MGNAAGVRLQHVIVGVRPRLTGTAQGPERLGSVTFSVPHKQW